MHRFHCVIVYSDGSDDIPAETFTLSNLIVQISLYTYTY